MVSLERVESGGCRSYLVGCTDTCAAALIDPEVSQIDRYVALAARDGLRIRYVIDTHTHADHFSARQQVAAEFKAQVVMHRSTPTPGVDMRVDEGDMVAVGKVRLQVLHTPGHTADSMCLLTDGIVFTGDTLLIGGTGRTDLPTGHSGELYDSLFGKVLKLDPATRVYPAHEYKNRTHTTIGDELASNPRLQVPNREAFIALMGNLNLNMPTHITEALRTNLSGGRTVAQMLSEAAAMVPFMSLAELSRRIDSGDPGLILLDVRERDAFEAGHVPGAQHLPRGQLELRVNQALPDPTRRILVYCELGLISTLAAATLRTMGFQRAVALDGGMKSWREAGHAVDTGTSAGAHAATGGP
ncbi:MBL fold metallo-hydrolase [Aquabacterium sp.]|uniref:MBL fold metallo-hydrolase n=1 Tax=Aquabacterium sp. TaxID=1872578 RepID=UPI003D6D1C12